MSNDEVTQQHGENKMTNKEKTALEEMGKRYAEGWCNSSNESH